METNESEKSELTMKVQAIINAPLEWKSPAICMIQDLEEARYEDALRLIKHHYFREEPMCKATSFLRDQPSVKGYMDLISTWMKDTTSLIALSRTSDRVIGVAVTRINSLSEKHDIYNRVPEGVALGKIMELQNQLIKEAKAYDEFQQDAYFRIHILCVHPSYDYTEIGSALLNACSQVAASLNLSAVGGIFGSANSQAMTLTNGFRLIAEILYSRWTVDNRVVFEDVGRGNYSVAFMGRNVSEEDASSD